MKTYDIVIIGGGASGLMCANNLAHIFSVAVIDGVALGKKLLVTGNGRCNFTNINLDSAFYNTKQVQKYIKEFDEKDTIKFFKEIGIESFADDEGRVYPLSESAKDVQKALTQKLRCDYISGKVIRLTKKGLFEITLESGEVVKSKKVVMACGNRNIEEILSDFKLPFEKKEPVVAAPVAPKSKKVVRKPFAEKMAKASDDIKTTYNILKNELISYGVKSRISHGADTFRLRKQEYAKITLVGKNLKLYVAVDPKKYEGTTFPVRDEGSKKCFATTPTMIKVKSTLSIKRAKMMIADLMAERGLIKGDVENVNYAKQLKARKPRVAKK